MELKIDYFILERKSAGNTKKGLSENEISCWYNKKNTTYNFTVRLDKHRKFVKAGMVGSNIVFHFNDESGLPLRKVGSKELSYTFTSKQLVELFITDFSQPKFRLVLKKERLQEDIFIIKKND